MGCNSSSQMGSAPPNANLPSKQAQAEEEMAAAAKEAEAKAAATPDVVAAKAAFEAALEEADEDQDKVVALRKHTPTATPPPS